MGRSHVRTTKVEHEGIVFDSPAEVRRYKQLQLLEEAGEIERLECHPPFDMIINAIKIGRYTGDFKYRRRRPFGGESLEVVEDVKGYLTPLDRYRLKVFQATHPQYDFFLIDSATLQPWAGMRKPTSARKKKMRARAKEAESGDRDALLPDL